MHADDVEEGFAIDVEAGAGACLMVFGFEALGEGGGGGEGAAFGGDAGGLEVGFAAHDGGDGGGEVAAGGGVVGESGGHEEGAEVGVSEAEGAVVVGVAGDGFGGVAGVVDEDLLGGDGDVDGVAVGGDVEVAGGFTNFMRLREARLQAESSRNMYSEQGLEALMRPVFLEVCHLLMVVSYCMPGSPQCQVASAILCRRSRDL